MFLSPIKPINSNIPMGLPKDEEDKFDAHQLPCFVAATALGYEIPSCGIQRFKRQLSTTATKITEKIKVVFLRAMATAAGV